MSEQERRERLKDVGGHGVGRVPQAVYAALDSDVPPRNLWDWSGVSVVWDRPTRHNWPYREEELAAAQEAWDRSAERVQAQKEAQARLDARRAQEKAAQEARDQGREEAAEARTREELRTRFFQNPSATEEDFERLYPQMRDEYLMREADQAANHARADMQARIRANF